MHFNLKHSNTQLSIQDKPNGLGFRCFNKFHVFTRQAICLYSSQIENPVIYVHQIFMDMKRNTVFRKIYTPKYKTVHKLPEFVVRFVSVTGTSHTILCFTNNLYTLMFLNYPFRFVSVLFL